MARYTLIFDIETVPTPEENLSREEIEYLYRRAETEEEEQRRREMMGMWAFTGHLVSVGLLIHERKVAKILYISKEEEDREEEVSGIKVKLRSFSLRAGIEACEKRILEEFWGIVGEKSVGRLVSFNGRSFDSVFLMLRSLILGVKATRNLIGNRYRYDEHLDLLDVLSFHGIGRLYSLDFMCRRMGIDSPKTDMSGKEVRDYFEEGKYREIAMYNLSDLIATDLLYDRFMNTIGGVLGAT